MLVSAANIGVIEHFDDRIIQIPWTVVVDDLQAADGIIPLVLIKRALSFQEKFDQLLFSTRYLAARLQREGFGKIG